MFVKKLKKLSVVAGGAVFGIYALGAVGISPAWAKEAPDWKIKDGAIPVTVTLKGITQTEGPIYVSIQTRENYRSMKGFGGVLKDPTLGDITQTFKVDMPGKYAVSVWHDLDDDGRFSMTEDYEVLDGWGASGNVPENREPEFDDVQIEIDKSGANIDVQMKYPNE